MTASGYSSNWPGYLPAFGGRADAQRGEQPASPVLYEFVRLPISEQAQYENRARAELGQHPSQRVLLDAAAQMWAREHCAGLDAG